MPSWAHRGAWMLVGLVLGLVVGRTTERWLPRRRRRVPPAVAPPLRRYSWDDFCLVLVHVQRDHYSSSAAVREAHPRLREAIAELIALCRAQAIEVVHLRNGSSPRVSPWYRFWLHMNPGGDACADPSAPEDFAAELPAEHVFISPGVDGVGVDSGLEPHLRSRGRSAVLVCGLLTSSSVHANAQGLFLRGYETFVVGDCCGDRTAKMHASVLQRENRRSYAVCGLEGVRALFAADPAFDLTAASKHFVAANTTQFEMFLARPTQA